MTDATNELFACGTKVRLHLHPAVSINRPYPFSVISQSGYIMQIFGIRFQTDKFLVNSVIQDQPASSDVLVELLHCF